MNATANATPSSPQTPAAIRAGLESAETLPDDALAALRTIAHQSPVRAVRIDAYRVLGDVAGRAFGVPWEPAERAAWAMLELVQCVDAEQEQRALIVAMGRAYRNAWLVPYVHAKIFDGNPMTQAAAVSAAGGLGFAGLEQVLVDRMLRDDVDATLRITAIASLGRMGATSAADKIAARIDRSPAETAAAFTALTEMRSPAGVDAAIARLAARPERDGLIAVVRYLSELGHDAVMPMLRTLARHEDAELRSVAGFAARAWKAERTADAGERLLAALTERDRAVRAVLARRLRTRPVDEVLSQAKMLLSDDAEGVVQVLADVRTPEVTRFLLELAHDESHPVAVRARAIAAIEANESWEREALVAWIDGSGHETIRAAAAQSIGSFGSLADVLALLDRHASGAATSVRAALLWALQLTVHPGTLSADDRKRCEKVLARALKDVDATVRRRAAYVAGNLQLVETSDELAALAREEKDRPDLRLAAFIGLGEIATRSRWDDLLSLARRETDASALAAALRALGRIAAHEKSLDADAARVRGVVEPALASTDATVRAASVELAGRVRGTVPPEELIALAHDPSPRVREQVLTALGRLGTPAAEPILLAAMEDADPAVHERAAWALLELATPRAVERLLDYVAGDDETSVRVEIAHRIALPAGDVSRVVAAVDRSLRRVPPTDPVYDSLLALKVATLEASVSTAQPSDPARVDRAIAAVFPAFARLQRARGFESLGRSVRTAEALFASAKSLADADQSAAIILWMKSLEGYVHAWLAPRMQRLQEDPMTLAGVADQVAVQAWPKYQRYLAERWTDPVVVGAASVDVPLRSVANALRDLQDRRMRRLDSPLSVTDWARLLVLLGVDHPSGVRNVLRIPSKTAEQTIRIAHRLHALAAVRNLVTHRATASTATLEAFRKTYYAGFEDLVALA